MVVLFHGRKCSPGDLGGPQEQREEHLRGPEVGGSSSRAEDSAWLVPTTPTAPRPAPLSDHGSSSHSCEAPSELLRDKQLAGAEEAHLLVSPVSLASIPHPGPSRGDRKPLPTASVSKAVLLKSHGATREHLRSQRTPYLKTGSDRD